MQCRSNSTAEEKEPPRFNTARIQKSFAFQTTANSPPAFPQIFSHFDQLLLLQNNIFLLQLVTVQQNDQNRYENFIRKIIQYRESLFDRESLLELRRFLNSSGSKKLLYEVMLKRQKGGVCPTYSKLSSQEAMNELWLT